MRSASKALTGRPFRTQFFRPARIKFGVALDEILATVHEDFGWEDLPDMARSDYSAHYKAGRQRDEFSTRWEVHTEGICGIPVEWPFADWNAYDSFHWPDLSAGPPVGRLYSGHVAGRSDDYYARGGGITFFEQMQQLRGMENLFMDLADGSREVMRLRDDLLAFNLRWLDKWLLFEYDGIDFADDWGDQNHLLISPALWRKLFKPAYKCNVREGHRSGNGCPFSLGWEYRRYHPRPDRDRGPGSELPGQHNGPGFIETGKFAGTVCFRTDLDRQKIVPFGTPAEVKKHVADVFDHLGTRRGGIIACGEIGPDTPLKNIRAMYQPSVPTSIESFSQTDALGRLSA